MDDPTNKLSSETAPTKQSKDRATNFSAMEDALCTLAYFCASKDPICGAKQKSHIFKQKIEAAYHQLKEAKYEEEKREAEHPNYLQANGGIGYEPRPYPPQSGNSRHIRFNQTISPALVKFLSVLKQNEKPKSGDNVGVWRRQLLSLYHEKYGTDFRFMQCYNVAKDKPKFLSLFGVQDLTAPLSSSSGSSNKDEGTATPAKRPSSTSVGNKSLRPVGTKKAKKMKQEDEMAERMAKKFGLATTTMEDKTTVGASPPAYTKP